MTMPDDEDGNDPVGPNTEIAGCDPTVAGLAASLLVVILGQAQCPRILC